MEKRIFETKDEMARAAADLTAERINAAIAQRGQANIILATGASQLDMIARLVQEAVDWSKVTAFHLDEYVGLAATHPASFHTYLSERFEKKVGGLRKFHYIRGEAPDPQAECVRVGRIIRRHPVDVACVGIGENAHLAFNDPPADFQTDRPFLIVEPDAAARRQQAGEGWFASPADVPQRAISMSIRQIMASRCIVCTVPDLRKAEAVRKTLTCEVTNLVPASILREHADSHLFLDRPAASLLRE